MDRRATRAGFFVRQRSLTDRDCEDSTSRGNETVDGYRGKCGSMGNYSEPFGEQSS